MGKGRRTQTRCARLTGPGQGRAGHQVARRPDKGRLATRGKGSNRLLNKKRPEKKICQDQIKSEGKPEGTRAGGGKQGTICTARARLCE